MDEPGSSCLPHGQVPFLPMQPRKELPWEFPRYIFKLDAAKALVEAHVQKRLAPLDPWQHVGRDQDDSQKAVGAMTCPAMVSKLSRWVESQPLGLKDHYFSVAMGQGFRGHWNENAVEWSKYPV